MREDWSSGVAASSVRYEREGTTEAAPLLPHEPRAIRLWRKAWNDAAAAAAASKRAATTHQHTQHEQPAHPQDGPSARPGGLHDGAGHADLP